MGNETAWDKAIMSVREVEQKPMKSRKCPLEATMKKSAAGTNASQLDIALTPESSKEMRALSVKEEAHKKMEEFLKMTGTSNSNIAGFLVDSTVGAFPKLGEGAYVYNVLLQGLHEMNPSDVIEGMLCSQIVALYAQGMDNLRRAANATSLEHRESYTRWAMKLLRLQQETIEKLEKYRRKGQQTVQVEHVHVHQGAQAIVGTVTTGGGV